jgi:hypothetical protein
MSINREIRHISKKGCGGLMCAVNCPLGTNGYCDVPKYEVVLPNSNIEKHFQYIVNVYSKNIAKQYLNNVEKIKLWKTLK